jgi:hypothetical protein
MVKVLVGERSGPSFPGFWAEFEGEEVSSYEDTRGDKNIVYTLYRCTAYNYEAYRVHIADESDPKTPVYELLPVERDTRSGGGRPDYSGVWMKENIAENYPLFLKDMNYFTTRNIDGPPSF